MSVSHVSIVGTGLIGTSLGFALRAAGFEVTGYDSDAAAAGRAHARGALHRAASSLEGCVADADLVVVATPVDEAVEMARAVAAAVPPDALLTDVGSAKTAIVAAYQDAAGPRFVGGHPMAGSERSGPDAAYEGMFDDAWWILTPTEATAPETYGAVNGVVVRLGARPIALDPGVHDRLLAWLSHVPQLLATSLVAAAVEGTDQAALLALAGGGFRDVTRIAASHGKMWAPVLRHNAQAVIEALGKLEGDLASVRATLEDGRWDDVMDLIDRSSHARTTLFDRPDLPSEPTVLMLAVPDRPGVLSQVTTAAAELHVNIEDIRIFHSTEGGRGRLELIVSGRAEALRLSERLASLGYVVDATAAGDEETHR